MPLEIPGTSSRPPDPLTGLICPRCHRFISVAKIITDPKDNKPKRICPYCGEVLESNE